MTKGDDVTKGDAEAAMALRASAEAPHRRRHRGWISRDREGREGILGKETRAN